MTADGTARELEVRADTVGTVPVLAVSGEVDVVSAPRLREAVDEALRTAPKLLVLDLSGVGFLGSAGLSVLLAVSRAVPGGLRLVLSRQARRPIEVTGMDEVLAVFDSVAAAVGEDPGLSR
ncbi:STAS domain-containing protein [Nocardia jejuensis]|uniref:STAS domain-containing protein n=1 Tax=Nocardia jejuensis TaxID=328049 RepID=UPI0008350CB0|nr:STAS domain-containing protein [Nocardia jejuensis]